LTYAAEAGCSGYRQHPGAVFGDIRDEEHTLCDGRSLTINPDQQMDFTNIPFRDGSFKLVVVDPPHLETLEPIAGCSRSMDGGREIGGMTFDKALVSASGVRTGRRSDI
jgi:hypothetical protein